ncbi:Nucleolar protein 16 [Pseudozyma hubeiensis]|nr:Nucleolar protein 16 [Pseudozyma hubeiensis]
MANPRQRRKARSGSTMKPSLNAKKQMKKKLSRAPTIHGADVLKDNYDPKLTLRQNYARLGLIPSLDVRPDSGGVERIPSASSSSADNGVVRKGMARVVRDEAGNIVDILEPEDDQDEETAWGKPMSTSIADRDDVETYMPSPTTNPRKGGNKTVEKLKEMASKAAPVKRHTSQLESQWLVDLVHKYGEDTEGMARDRKLNLWQKTEGEIKRAIKKAGGVEALKGSE